MINLKALRSATALTLMMVFAPAVLAQTDSAADDLVAPNYPPHAEFILHSQWPDGYCGELVVSYLPSRTQWQVTAGLKGDVLRVAGATYRGVFDQPYNLVFTPDLSWQQDPHVIPICATGDHILEVHSVDVGQGVRHRPLVFKELARGYMAADVSRPLNLVANTPEELRRIESMIGQRLNVEMDRYTVIATFMGMRSTGGYGIEVVSAVEIPGRPDALEVELMLSAPGINCFVTLGTTFPFQVVAVPKTERQVNFVERHRVVQCQQPT